MMLFMLNKLHETGISFFLRWIKLSVKGIFYTFVEETGLS